MNRSCQHTSRINAKHDVKVDAFNKNRSQLATPMSISEASKSSRWDRFLRWLDLDFSLLAQPPFLEFLRRSLYDESDSRSFLGFYPIAGHL